jgi:hypothetical protein
VGPRLDHVFVAAPGFATAVYVCELPGDLIRRDAIKIAMQEGATIRVLVVGRGGRPQPFEVVQLNRGAHRIAAAETDDDGIAWFRNLRSGSYFLNVRSRLRTLVRCDIDTAAGGRVHEVKLANTRAPVRLGAEQGPR